MMTEQEIIAEQKETRQRIKELNTELDQLNRKLEWGYQKVCPHPKERQFDSWGQYLPSETICSLCNKVLKG